MEPWGDFEYSMARVIADHWKPKIAEKRKKGFGDAMLLETISKTLCDNEKTANLKLLLAGKQHERHHLVGLKRCHKFAVAMMFPGLN